MQVATSGGNDTLSISVVGEEGVSIKSHEASTNGLIEFVVDSPKLWSPDSPNLYNLSIKLGVSTTRPRTSERRSLTVIFQ